MKFRIFVLSLFVLIIKSENSYAQFVVDLPKVDLIVFSKNRSVVDFYIKKNTNQYAHCYLDLDPLTPDNVDSKHNIVDIDEYTQLETMEEITGENSFVFYVDSLKETSATEFIGKIFEVKEEWNRRVDDSSMMAFAFLNKMYASEQRYETRKVESGGGFGSYIERDNDDEIKLRLANRSFFSTVVINFGNNKHIWLLYRGKYFDYGLIPMKDSIYITDGDGFSSVTETQKYKPDYDDMFSGFSHYNHHHDYEMLRQKNDKYELISCYGRKLIDKAYDTIVFNGYFVIGRDSDKTDIYNACFEKVEINSLKAAYLYRTKVEVLTDSGAYYLDADFNIIMKFPAVHYTLCGTVFSTTYEMITYKSSCNIKMQVGGMASEVQDIYEFYFEKQKQRDKITFLNDRSYYSWDDNDKYMGNYYGYPELLKVKRGKRYGIFKCDYEHSYDLALDTIKDWKGHTVNHLPDFKDLKEVLPVVYDSIIYNYGLIFYYKKNKVGIFPRDKDVYYDKIERVTHSFYAILRNEKKGWWDRVTNREYFEK